MFTQNPDSPHGSEFTLAVSLLSAWSVADDELRPKLEALIAEYVERKPEFVNELKHVTNMSEQLGVVLSAVRSGRPPQRIEAMMIQTMMHKEGGAPSA